ncbi:MAG: excinuclease ABC subunit UvrC [Bacteroidetes bacterium]|nr:MAG: excinuclease ABC subunit UvrC [Bacteroidota bacterium]
MAKDELKSVIKQLPDLPGVYKYYNAEDEIIYIGKAKNLKKRVSSYFTKKHDSRKTALMVSKIQRLEFTIVESEVDALLLENSLIKEFQPRYNINLKDDKTYPFIRLTKERFPKIFPTRQPVKDGSEYFGPYASGRMMHTILDMIRQLYPLRNCNLNLSDANIKAGKFKVCLEYHIGNCKGPCEGLQSEADYMESLEQVRRILKGNIGEAVQHLKHLMQAEAAELRYEQAALYKQKLDMLENYQSKSTVVSQTIHDVDVFSIAADERYAFVNFMKVANGMIIQTQTVELKKQLDESKEELLAYAIVEMRNRYNSTSTEVIVPFDIDIDGLRFTIPKLGDKKKLLELSTKNALFYKKEKLEQYERLNPDVKVERVMNQMMQDLRLTEPPYHIECFDNSNLQGTNAVSACVVFRNGKASKKDYRHFNVNTVEGPNDFATMKEVLHRRYGRMLQEGESLPQLIVLDGGKGQLSSGVEALKEIGIYGKVAIVGIAKRLEEIYYPEDPMPLYIDKKSESLKIIQQMRDEAHRFGITHHRNRRSKNTFKTELTEIKGIGEESSRQLLAHFKSIKKIKSASLAELESVLGKAKAKIVQAYFQQADQA